LEEIQPLTELAQYLQPQSTIQFEFPWPYFCNLKSAEIVSVLMPADPVGQMCIFFILTHLLRFVNCFSWIGFGVGHAKVRVVHERLEAVGGFLLSPRVSQDSTASFQVAPCC
jgi:hypothetical protein